MLDNPKPRWIPVLRPPLRNDTESQTFIGGTRKGANDEEVPVMGLYISDQHFAGGTVSATIEFTAVTQPTGCEIVLRYEAGSASTLNIGVPANSYPLFALREYRNSSWTYIAQVGDRLTALEPHHRYELTASVAGSTVRMEVDGVLVVDTTLAQPLTRSQVGLFCIDTAEIVIHDFKVESAKPTAFVVMQFSSPYNDVYTEVIREVCRDFGVEVVRIDERSAPTMIVADISRMILESTLVIADITPVNANVFYEVGYAHGTGKPTILIAERNTNLPFDISAFRTLFYDNTIVGKPKLETGLRSAMRSILDSQGAPRA